MDKTKQNREAVRKFREKEKQEKAEREERLRKTEEVRQENKKKRREIEEVNAQIRNTGDLLREMAKHNPSFGQHPSVKKFL